MPLHHMVPSRSATQDDISGFGGSLIDSQGHLPPIGNAAQAVRRLIRAQAIKFFTELFPFF